MLKRRKLVISLSALLLLTVMLLLSTCSNPSDEVDSIKNKAENADKYQKVSEYSKLMENAAKELNCDELEKAKKLYSKQGI